MMSATQSVFSAAVRLLRFLVRVDRSGGLSPTDHALVIAVVRRCVTTLALFLLFLAASSRDLGAQATSCDLDPVVGPYGYRPRGDRCEGLYEREVGGTPLFLVSVTEFFEDFDAGSRKPLVVEWSSPAGSAVQLRAEGLKHDLYYRMDSRPPAGTKSYTWPSDVLAALKIKRADIGVVGRTRLLVGGTERTVFVPLRVRQAQAAAECGTYLIMLFPTVEFDSVFISLASLGPDGRPEKWLRRDKELGYDWYPAEQPIRVPVTELSARGVHELSISAKRSSGGSAPLRYWFYHAGPSSGCGR